MALTLIVVGDMAVTAVGKLREDLASNNSLNRMRKTYMVVSQEILNQK